MKSNIEAIIFDFGGVMVNFVQLDSFQEQEARLGLQAGKLAEILWRSPDWRLAEVGAITDEEYWRRIGAQLGLHTSEAIRDFQQHLFRDAKTDPRMADLVRWLRGRYRTGLLSNASDILPRLIRERYGLAGLFDVEVVSALVGLAKPDPAIYQLALERLGAAPEVTVFVDDYEPNVEAAAALGIRGIHFVGYEALIPALQKQGVILAPTETDHKSK
ncbi:HAD family phosphatase [Candidatus Dependentiae bacterium]|nr:HAD family phosphatase [Candidatus Dependentiae bacterium]